VRFYPGTGYAFHSRLYYPNGKTLKDSSIGWPVSAGCIRMLDADINYLYNYIPNGTAVLIY
jgi:lipoprotein-anchoring transpeptidase ErfK/SrfK